MRSIPVLVIAVLVAVLSACGSDGDSDSDDGSAPDPTTAAADPTTADADGGGGAATPAASDSDGSNDDDAAANTASVTAGDESFTFEVECQFGTGIIRGGGEMTDGTPAYLVASMPVDDSGGPANDPAGISLNLYVGQNSLQGPFQYEYWLNSNTGSVGSYTDDGEQAEGTVQYQYRTADGAKDGLAYGDLVDGTFAANCS